MFIFILCIFLSLYQEQVNMEGYKNFHKTFCVLSEYQMMPDEIQNTSASTKNHFGASICIMNKLFYVSFSACNKDRDSRVQDT